MHELLIIEHLLVILDEILPPSSDRLEIDEPLLTDGDDDAPEQ